MNEVEENASVGANFVVEKTKILGDLIFASSILMWNSDSLLVHLMGYGPADQRTHDIPKYPTRGFQGYGRYTSTAYPSSQAPGQGVNTGQSRVTSRQHVTRVPPKLCLRLENAKIQRQYPYRLVVTNWESLWSCGAYTRSLLTGAIYLTMYLWFCERMGRSDILYYIIRL
jgi:hypothetical protein